MFSRAERDERSGPACHAAQLPISEPAPTTWTRSAPHTPHRNAEPRVRDQLLITRPFFGALTRYVGYGKPIQEALVTLSAASINQTSLTTKVGFLRALKEHVQYVTLGQITAATTIISGGADKSISTAHAHELVAGIPGATHRHHRGAGHMLHEAPELVSDAIADARRTSASASVYWSSVTATGRAESRSPTGNLCAAPGAVERRDERSRHGICEEGVDSRRR